MCIMQQQASVAPANFYDQYDMEGSIAAARALMDNHKAQQRYKQAGANHTTKALVYALFRSVCDTMNRLGKTQPHIRAQCEESNTFFAFTTAPLLAALMNDNKNGDYPHSGVSDRTVRRHLYLLEDLDIIVARKNHKVTLGDPTPGDQLSSGRGKIALFINPEVFHIVGKMPELPAVGEAASDDKNTPVCSSLPNKRTTCPQLNSLLDKEPKSIINTPQNVDKALPIGKSDYWSISGKERISKPIPSFLPKNSAEILKKPANGSPADALWRLSRALLYGGRSFNEEVNNSVQEMLKGALAKAQRHVQAYRTDQIGRWCTNPAHLMARDKFKSRKKFASKLPDIDRSALEIVAKAIEKQANYANRKGIKVWNPMPYFSSKAFHIALNYSLTDWSKIQARFFQKNRASAAWFGAQQDIVAIYSKAVHLLKCGSWAHARKLTLERGDRWQQALSENPWLSDSQKKELFNQLFTSINTLFHE